MEIENIINKIVIELNTASGIKGIVLGGSRAKGTHRKDSDIDIGIYYSLEDGFNIEELNNIATKLDDENRESLIVNLGEWGNWVNAGGWLKVDGYEVDFIFRDINRVEKVIDDCLKGKINTNYQTGHPHGFLNLMYMGEIDICKIVVDNENIIKKLKSKARPYPEKIRDTIYYYFLFETKFSLEFIKKNIYNEDIYYIAGHLFRMISSINQILFAINGEYCINEKNAVKMINEFNIKPKNYKDRIDIIFSSLNNNFNQSENFIKILDELVVDIEELV